MRRQISSPPFWLHIFAGVILARFFETVLNPKTDLMSFEIFLFAAAAVAIEVTAIQKSLELKNVELSDSGLFISHRFLGQNKEIFVPFEEITEIRQKSEFSPRRIFILKTRTLTRFGSEIHFIPKNEVYGLNENPVIDELNKKIGEAKLLNSN